MKAGHGFRRMAERKPPQRKGRASYFVGGRRQPGKERESEFGGCVATGEGTWSRVLGIVGRDGGYTAKVADVVIVIPTVNPQTSRRTRKHSKPSYGICGSLIPQLKVAETKWESTK